MYHFFRDYNRKLGSPKKINTILTILLVLFDYRDYTFYKTMKIVLVVDDDKKIADEISAHLSSYKTYCAASAITALEIAKKVQPDIILLNPFLPGMDGFFMLDKMQQYSRLKYTPVILMTPDDSPGFQQRGLQSGVVDFILRQSNCCTDRIMDWEILKIRLEMHLQLDEYRISLEHSVKELENNIGLSFAELIECKDYNYSGHIIRTERYAEFLALALYNTGTFPGYFGLSYIEDFTKAVPFHDIGKIGISDEILCKQGPLDDEELQAARSHTTIGAQILRDISMRVPDYSYFNIAAIIALGHHERFDGTGYPEGLSGDDIPLACRITSVVNVYDACVSERVYHKAMSHEDACKEIEKGSGGEFDPGIVEVFLSYKNEFARLGKELKTITDSFGKLTDIVQPARETAGVIH